MNNTLLALCLCILGFLTPLRAADLYVVNSASRTLSHINLETGTVNNTFSTLGLTPNLMDIDADNIYVVCSGDNAVQVISRPTGTHLRYIPIAPSSNPWDVIKVNGYLYVSGLFTDKVYKLNPTSGVVVGSLQVGAAPEGLASDGTRLFVCNTGGYANNYAGSSISVIDLASFSLTQTIPVWTNPQYAVVYDGKLHVSCTGNWINTSGKVDIIDLNTYELTERLDIGGNPGCLWINSEGIAYLGEGMGSGVYSYDATSYQVTHGAANPLPLSAFAMHGLNGTMAFLEQNWTGNSQVRLLSPNLEQIGLYTLGITSTDLRFYQTTSVTSDEVVKPPTLRLYPNPSRSEGHITLKSDHVGTIQLTLFNLKGQRIWDEIANGGTCVLSLGGLPAGLYFYRAEGIGLAMEGKLMIVK